MEMGNIMSPFRVAYILYLEKSVHIILTDAGKFVKIFFKIWLSQHNTAIHITDMVPYGQTVAWK